MAKKFFVSVSPKAVQGIRKAYAGKNAEIHAKVQKDGTVIVVVETADDPASEPKRQGRWLKRRPLQVADPIGTSATVKEDASVNF